MRLFPKLKLSLRLARMVYPKLMRMAYRFVDLDSESSSLDSRVVEYSFVISKLAGRTGKVLDVGCTDGGNMAAVMLASLGWEVHGIDNREFRFEHPNFRFSQGDIRNAPFPDDFFDYVYAVSTLEHIGLKGRYGVTEEDPEGDMKAVGEIGRILRPGGHFLLTIPYGKGQSVKPLLRVYAKSRLRRLFHHWKIEEEIYYTFERGYWVTVPQQLAAEKDYLKGERALALLELTPLK